MENEILRVKDVCEMLHISRTTVYHLINTGQLQASYVNNQTKIRKHPRFTVSDVEKYMKANAAKKKNKIANDM